MDWNEMRGSEKDQHLPKLLQFKCCNQARKICLKSPKLAKNLCDHNRDRDRDQDQHQNRHQHQDSDRHRIRAWHQERRCSGTGTETNTGTRTDTRTDTDTAPGAGSTLGPEPMTELRPALHRHRD
ncbi:hypothetical protein DUI87_34360 [Hirundo rustica rustica]|uniref:Uncharacterized protein n=1 Tax=Hirundo rustica rustica TaxID=333673 RepID=A0A3M0IKE7_HIRRU|nr:hypothetical protein DUI87_34360 [Hirundo rustica rustica]